MLTRLREKGEKTEGGEGRGGDGKEELGIAQEKGHGKVTMHLGHKWRESMSIRKKGGGWRKNT